MWSGPRNVSTALMRSFESRGDSKVCDEPLYAHYLDQTGRIHPGRDEVLGSQPVDWRVVLAELTGPLPEGVRLYFQKHMAHHLLPNIDRAALEGLTHAFLIRDPREMLPSLARVLKDPVLADTGLPQQVEILRSVREETGALPPILDSRDLLENPEGLLRALCDRLGIEFDPRMLHWEPGPRSTDGVWAEHWYGSVEQSTGFAPYVPKSAPLSPELEALYEECLPHYRELHALRLQAS